MTDYIIDQMGVVQPGKWLCYIRTTKALNVAVSWHYDARDLELYFERDGIQYDIFLSRTRAY